MGILVATMALWLAARGLGVDELHTTATAAGLLVLAAAIWVASPQRVTTTIQAEPMLLTPGERAAVRVTVANTGVLPTPRADIGIHHQEGVELRPPPPLPALAPGRRRTVTVDAVARQRGAHRLGPLEVLRRDPFGIVVRRAVLDASTELLVTPPTTTLAPPLPLVGVQGSGDAVARRTGWSGTDLVEIRPYVPGDDLRGVHWPSTAHRGELMIRRVEEPQSPRAGVFLDTRGTRFAGGRGRERFEVAVAAAASIGVHFIDRGIDVAVVDGQTPRDASDPEPRSRLLRRLARVSPGEATFDVALHDLEDLAAGTATLVAVIAPTPADELAALTRASRTSSQCVAVVVGDGDDAAETAETLRRAGWRSTVLADAGELPARWRELTVARVG